MPLTLFISGLIRMLIVVASLLGVIAGLLYLSVPVTEQVTDCLVYGSIAAVGHFVTHYVLKPVLKAITEPAATGRGKEEDPPQL